MGIESLVKDIGKQTLPNPSSIFLPGLAIVGPGRVGFGGRLGNSGDFVFMFPGT